MDLCFRPDIHAAGWFIDDENIAFSGQPFRQRDFLLVAAAETGNQRLQRGRLDAKPVGVTMNQRRLRATIDDTKAGQAIKPRINFSYLALLGYHLYAARGIEGPQLIGHTLKRQA